MGTHQIKKSFTSVPHILKGKKGSSPTFKLSEVSAACSSGAEAADGREETINSLSVPRTPIPSAAICPRVALKIAQRK